MFLYPSRMLQLSMNAALMGYEAQNIIGLRLLKLAAGGRGTASETDLMVSEKVEALLEAQAAIATGLLTGQGLRGAEQVVGLYRRRMRANNKRLSRRR